MDSISNNKSGNEVRSLEQDRRALKEPGLRVTSQRALILEIIRQGQGHLDADEVYRRAREQKPRLSLSTVYRTLQTLKKLDLIDEVHIDETHHHYEIKTSAEHHHLVCLGCGRVVEFSYPLAQRIKKSVAEAKNFKITSGEVRIEGYCPDCQEKEA